jgi:hypothetical protein
VYLAECTEQRTWLTLETALVSFTPVSTATLLLVTAASDTLETTSVPTVIIATLRSPQPRQPGRPAILRILQDLSTLLYQNFAAQNQAFESSTTLYSVVGAVDFSTSPHRFTGFLFSIGLTKNSRAMKKPASKLLVLLLWPGAR